MLKTIPLVCPHPFIVSTIKSFIEQNGFVARKLDALADLPVSTPGASGAIVYLGKDDLESLGRRVLAARSVQRHFR